MTEISAEQEARSISEIKEDLEHLDTLWDQHLSLPTTAAEPA